MTKRKTQRNNKRQQTKLQEKVCIHNDSTGEEKEGSCVSSSEWVSSLHVVSC
jgi:hypothetical protein